MQKVILQINKIYEELQNFTDYFRYPKEIKWFITSTANNLKHYGKEVPLEKQQDIHIETLSAPLVNLLLSVLLLCREVNEIRKVTGMRSINFVKEAAKKDVENG